MGIDDCVVFIRMLVVKIIIMSSLMLLMVWLMLYMVRVVSV